MCPNYNALDWEHPLEFHPYFDWPELKIFHHGLRLCVLFLTIAEQRGYGTVPPIGVCCPLLEIAVVLGMSGNTAYMWLLSKPVISGMPTLAQVFLISKPGHFDRIALGNNYTRTCADRWGGVVVSEHRMGRGSCSITVFTWRSCSQTALWPATLPCSCLFF